MFGEQLNFTTLVPFPDLAGAFGIVDPQGGFTLQWSWPPEFPGLSLYRVVLTLDPQTMTADDTNLQCTRIE